MNNNFWATKNVLITGINGFIGSNLANSLLKQSANVIGLVRNKIPKSNLHISEIESKIVVVQGLLEDTVLLEGIITKYNIDYIFHLGAQSIISLAYKSPLSTFESNIKGTWSLLESVRRTKPTICTVVASSDKAYGEHIALPYKESFSLSAKFPYEISKACTDLISRGYFSSYHIPVAVMRCANTYGPGDVNLSRIIPGTIYSLLKGQEPVIGSNGNPIRDYLFVDDTVDAYLKVAASINDPRVKGEAFNAGTDKYFKVIEIVEKLISISGEMNLRPKIMGKDTIHGEIDCQYLDSKKIESAVGWRYNVSLDKGLRKTWEWWVSNWSLLKGLLNQ